MAAEMRAKASGLNLFDSREKPLRVKTGYLEERNGGQILFLEKTSFVLICNCQGYS